MHFIGCYSEETGLPKRHRTTELFEVLNFFKDFGKFRDNNISLLRFARKEVMA